MKQQIRRVVAVVVLTLGFTAFVGAYALQSVEGRLAQTFAEQQQVNSMSVASRLMDRYQLAKLAAGELSADLPARPATLGDSAHLAALSSGLGLQQVAFYRCDSHGRVLARQPADATPPSSELLARLVAECGAGQPAEAFARLPEQPPVLVLAYRLANAPTQAVAVTVAVAKALNPVTGGEHSPGKVYVLDATDEALPVLASTEPQALGRDFAELYGTPAGGMIRGLRRRAFGVEPAAQALDTPDRPQYLLGTFGLRFETGGHTYAVANAAPRNLMVEPYMHNVLRWVLLLGGVVLLSLGSFAALVGQMIYAGVQEQRRTEERQALYKISQSLQSASALADVLQSITEQARNLFRTDGATIALTDAATGELVFGSVSNADPAATERLQGLRLPRGEGVVGWVVTHGEALLIQDVAADPRFPRSIVLPPGVQTEALVCAPLLDQRGQAFGAIELVSYHGEPFPDSDLVLLQSLAVTAAAAVERAMLLEQEKVQERLQREMDIARTVQRSLLPQHAPVLPTVQLAGLSHPANEVGGDFYDYLHLDETHLGIAIADVADKGLGAAMFMVMCRSLLYNSASVSLSPAAALADLNARLVEVATSGMFVTLFYAVLDTRTGHLTCASAGHNPPLLHRAGAAAVEPLPVRGIALGVFDSIDLTEYELSLSPGDRLVLYTDGVPDAIDAHTEAFGLQRFEQAVLDSADFDAAGTLDAILAAVTAHTTGEPQFDDLTLAVVRAVTPGA